MDKIIRGFSRTAIDTAIESLKILAENDKILKDYRGVDYLKQLTPEASMLLKDICYFVGLELSLPTEPTVAVWKNIFTNINASLHTKLKFYFNDDDQPLMFLFI
jgi:hypothetical protein